ncbi:MAG: hypothetical protein ABL880_07215 [Methylotenera sp.]
MRAFAILVSLITVSICNAQEKVVGYGVGAQGCGKYIEQRRTPNNYYDSLIATWFYGFASGHNFYASTSQINREVDSETVLAYLDKYCRDYPLASVSVGANELINIYAK